MSRIPVTEVFVVEGPSYMTSTEDGPMPTWDFNVIASAAGQDYCHPVTYWKSRRPSADAFADKVRRAGSIDPTLWVAMDPPTSLEERWDAMAQHEAEERLGLRAPHDMYHGIPLH
jgi:hypothetical protein